MLDGAGTRPGRSTALGALTSTRVPRWPPRQGIQRSLASPLVYGAVEVLNDDPGVVEVIAGAALFLLVLVVAGLLLTWLSVGWEAREGR